MNDDRTDYPHWGDESEPTALEECAWWLLSGVGALSVAGLAAWGVWFFFFGG
jgi:hypothetical protein